MSDLTPWRTLRRDVVFSGGPIHEVAVEAVELPDGRIIPDYYVIRLPDYVLVYAEMRDSTVAVMRRYRHGARRVCLTFPGGAIDAGELPLEAARRELIEELGCEADSWQSLGAFVTNANQGCNTAHLFRATGCHHVTEPQAPDLEETRLEYLRPEDLLTPGRLQEIGLAAHVVLLLLVMQPGASGHVI